MGFIQVFNKPVNSKTHVHHRLKVFDTIGTIVDDNEELNICKVKFVDIDNKERSYWFHRFTGNVVTLPKEKGQWADDVPADHKTKGYCLSNEQIFLWQLNPGIDLLNTSSGKKENNSERNPII